LRTVTFNLVKRFQEKGFAANCTSRGEAHSVICVNWEAAAVYAMPTTLRVDLNLLPEDRLLVRARVVVDCARFCNCCCLGLFATREAGKHKQRAREILKAWVEEVRGAGLAVQWSQMPGAPKRVVLERNF